MNATEFDAALDELDLTRTGFSRLIGIDPSTATGWGKLRNGLPSHIPAWVPFALTALKDPTIRANAGRMIREPAPSERRKPTLENVDWKKIAMLIAKTARDPSYRIDDNALEIADANAEPDAA